METFAEKFGGIYPALLTPFTKEGRINRTSLERLVRHEMDLGADGFYVCGSTGEAFLMSKEERREVMEIVRNAAPGKKLIAQIDSPKTTLIEQVVIEGEVYEGKSVKDLK